MDETSGSSGAKLLTLEVDVPPRPVRLRAKWREYGASLFNDARKEIAAYAAQRLLFEPHEYVVPPSAGRCFRTRFYHETLGGTAEASFQGTDCVFGSLSYWLEHVHGGERYSEARFRSDADYRRAMADVNLFTFLIQHGDTHDGNFLITERTASLRVYSPDNAIAFSPYFRNPLDLLRDNWYELRVPALRREVVDRLRRVEDDELGALAVIEQYRVQRGMLVPTAPGAPVSEDAINRREDALQLGLSADEIDRLRERIHDALARVDAGEIAVF